MPLTVPDNILASLSPYRRYAFDAGVACVAIWVFLRWLCTSRRTRTAQLRGPPSESFVYGLGKRIHHAENSGALYETWAQEYGPVYSVPSTLGSKKIVMCDPKAISHFFSKDSWTYIQTPLMKKFRAFLFGKGLVWAHGEEHRRQRNSLAPAFSAAAIRELTPHFYDSAYKAKGAWDVLIESSGGGGALINVQDWMNRTSLDIIGIAGFSHNFGGLEGKHADVTQIFDDLFHSCSGAFNMGILLLGQTFPFLLWVPTRHGTLVQKFNTAIEEIANVILKKTQKEIKMGVVGDEKERSVIGLLIKGASHESKFHLTRDEVVSQMKTVLVGGYETTSGDAGLFMKWALLELSRDPEIQIKLRKELLEHGADPTYDQLSSSLPYLDAVVHEVLRLHPPVLETTRIAIEDDVIPLSEPVRTMAGELVDSLNVTKGTVLFISTECMNRSVAIWGEDAKMFRPSRWLEDGENGIPAKAKEIQGHRHLLTFIDGPRGCLGKNFAVTEIKAVLTVLVKNFVFEQRDGIDTKIEIEKGLFPRPKVMGEVGLKLPLRVRPYVA